MYPGVRMDPQPAEAKDDGYYLMVGRFVHYKRFDLGVEACNRLGRKLIVAGGDKVSVFQYNKQQSQLTECGQCDQDCPLKV